jgi:tyramine---L-glutamate ligase
MQPLPFTFRASPGPRKVNGVSVVDDFDCAMLIFVYEFVCGGGLSGAEIAASLRREGWAMLDAVLQDFGHCRGVQTVTLLDGQWQHSPSAWPNHRTVLVAAGEEKARFVELARQADFTLVIAPEFDDVLFTRCRWVVETGGRLLGPAPDAVRLTADKLLLAEHFQQCGVPTPATRSWHWSNTVGAFPLVLKPRFGAGSQATFLLHNHEDVVAARHSGADGWAGELIEQPYCPGVAASVAFLRGHDNTIALPAAAQHLSTDGRFRYQGGALPLPPDLEARAQRLGGQAVAAVDGLFGYVGVDVVLGSANDVVIEINPRLTTSYVGLRRLARFNLAEALLAVTAGTPLPCLDWHSGSVCFHADGTLEQDDESVAQSLHTGSTVTG